MKYDSENIWWKRHIYDIERARELSNEDFIIDIPDIIENLDILTACLYLLFPRMNEDDAVNLIKRAERDWKEELLLVIVFL